MKAIYFFFILTLLFTACGRKEEKKERQEGWTDLKVAMVTDVCTETIFSEKGSPSVTLERSRSYCSCMVDKLSYKYTYSDVASFTDYTIEKVKEESAKSCADDSGLNWSSENGVSLD